MSLIDWLSKGLFLSNFSSPLSRLAAISESSVNWPASRPKVPPPFISIAMWDLKYLLQRFCLKVYAGTSSRRPVRLRSLLHKWLQMLDRLQGHRWIFLELAWFSLYGCYRLYRSCESFALGCTNTRGTYEDEDLPWSYRLATKDESEVLSWRCRQGEGGMSFPLAYLLSDSNNYSCRSYKKEVIWIV